MLKRVFLYLRRQYLRNILLTLLLFTISFCSAMGLILGNSIDHVVSTVQNQLGNSFVLKMPPLNSEDPLQYVPAVLSDGTHSKG